MPQQRQKQKKWENKPKTKKKKKNNVYMPRKLQAADINLRNLFCANKKTTRKTTAIRLLFKSLEILQQ